MEEIMHNRILVVEDDQAAAMLVRMRLEAAGFDVQTVASGAAALTAAEHRPDLVILDLRLPDISGYEVCRNLRRLFGPWAVPVLMLTGMDKPIEQLRGFAFGADAYLTKPYDAHELLRTVCLLLEQPALV